MTIVAVHLPTSRFANPGSKLADIECDRCGKTQRRSYFAAKRAKKHYCCISCIRNVQMSQIPTFRQSSDGYFYFKKTGHPLANKGGDVYLHRLIYWQESGYDSKVRDLLNNGATVHHRNGKSDDNRPDNLELRISDHGQGIGEKDMVHTLTGLGYTVQSPLWRKEPK